MIYDDVDPTWQRKAQAFHVQNPHVMRIFLQFARAARQSRHKIGVDLIWTRMRWEVAMSTTDDNSHFKINDAYQPWYSRTAMDLCPELRGFFDTRRRVAA